MYLDVPYEFPLHLQARLLYHIVPTRLYVI